MHGGVEMTGLNLGGYPARKCPRVVHNENMPDKPEPAETPAQLLQLGLAPWWWTRGWWLRGGCQRSGEGAFVGEGGLVAAG